MRVRQCGSRPGTPLPYTHYQQYKYHVLLVSVYHIILYPRFLFVFSGHACIFPSSAALFSVSYDVVMVGRRFHLLLTFVVFCFPHLLFRLLEPALEEWRETMLGLEMMGKA